MATTVLECQDFATVLLDTEGIDAVGASETMAMSLLALTTLLSSFLIYNSKNVPQKLDLSKMRCFSQLSASLLAQRRDSMSINVKKAFFPHFLWLLRDVSLTMTDTEGKQLDPTEFLHTRLLASASGELTDLGKSLVGIFPSLECATLPLSSIRSNLLRDIFNNQDKLNPKFNSKVDTLIQQILLKITPIKAVDGTVRVTGKALAALAECYVEAVNRPGALPDLDQGWQAVITLELKEYSYRLVREYEAEMEKALEEKLQVEEQCLLSIHHSNCRAEVGVKTIKRLITGNVGKDGAINIDAFQEAILQYRNTPDPTTKLSPAMCVFGRPVKDLIPILPGKYHPHPTWRNSLDLREEALRHRHMRHQEKWSEHTKLLPPLKIGDRVRIQNQTGSHPNKWDRTGIVTEVRQFHQYLIRIDGSGRQTLRNRKFLRKYIPMYQPAKRRSILEDIARLPPTPPSDATTTSPKLLTDPPPTPPHTPRKDTTSPTTPTRPDTGVNIPPPQTSHSPDSLITPPPAINPTQPSPEPTPPPEPTPTANPIPTPQPLRRSTRIKKPPIRLQ